ncbi:FAD-binding protein [Brevundimonas aurantiaca]|nr:FAD-binding protein [Brevundimonas aurantiaca]
MTERRYDVAVVGAGIVGLACALAAARRGSRWW